MGPEPARPQPDAAPQSGPRKRPLVWATDEQLEERARLRREAGPDPDDARDDGGM